MWFDLASACCACPTHAVSARSEMCALPCVVPRGQEWVGCIANRTFKTRVIELVLLRLPSLLLKERPGKRLIIDYHQPISYESATEWAPLLHMATMGEADVKFVRYTEDFPKLLVDSIDGDSVPIALLHHERKLRAQECPGRVSICRIKIKLEPDAGAKRKAESEAGAKRKAESEAKQGKGERARPAPREHEYVDIQLLYQALRAAALQSSGRVRAPAHEGHEMAMLVALIGLTGTDFSRGLPQVSGKSVYNMLPSLWPSLLAVYDPPSGQLRVDEAVNILVAKVYSEKFAKHCPSSAGKRGGLAGVLASLKASSLGARVRDSIPSPARVECTLQNANWVLQYWTCAATYPNPISPQFGFKMHKGRPTYADVAPA